MATLLVALAAALLAGPGTSTFGVKAGLDGRQQVPPVSTAATGTLSGTLVVTGRRGTLTWRLTFGHLTGKAARAELRRGRLGRRGPAITHLCAPCAKGAQGSTRLTATAVAAIRGGGAYVVVATRAHPAGEIRGQLRVLSGA